MDKLKESDFASKEEFKLYQYALKKIEAVNDRIDKGHKVFDKEDRPITGKFVCDHSGAIGFGIKRVGGYQHLFGSGVEKKDDKGETVLTKEGKPVILLRMGTTVKKIDDYFNGLTFVKPEAIEKL